jgi:hypothetical protein
MRTWMTLAAASLLAVASLRSPARADDPPADRNTKLDRMSQALGQIQRDLAQMQRDLEEMRTTENVRNSQTAAHTSQIGAMEERMARLERQIADLMNGRGQTTTSGYFSPGNGGAAGLPALPRRGLVHIVNRYDLPATVTLNDRSYSVMPHQAIDVRNIPAGVFRYEIEVEGYGVIQPETARALAPGGKHDIVIYPRVPANTDVVSAYP